MKLKYALPVLLSTLCFAGAFQGKANYTVTKISKTEVVIQCNDGSQAKVSKVIPTATTLVLTCEDSHGNKK